MVAIHEIPSGVSNSVDAESRTLVDYVESIGKPGDAAAADPTLASSVIALLKGILTRLGVPVGSGAGDVNDNANVFPDLRETLGAMDDAAVTDASERASAIALLKGMNSAFVVPEVTPPVSDTYLPWSNDEAFDPLFTNAHITLSDSSRTGTVASVGVDWQNTRSLSGHASGAYYAEFVFNTDASVSGVGVGLVTENHALTTFLGAGNTSYLLARDLGFGEIQWLTNNLLVDGEAGAIAAGDNIGVALDFDATPARAWLRHNGGDWFPAIDVQLPLFRAAAREQEDTVYLLIPPGTYVPFTYTPFEGIGQLVVWGYGATIATERLTSYAGFSQVSGYDALVETVEVNDTVATLVTLADASKFSVGDWCSLAALDLQGNSGFPPNHYYNQFVEITAIDGLTGQITFSPPAEQQYKSTFPSQQSEGAEYNPGGPAALFKMTESRGASAPASASAVWDTEVEIYGLTVVSETPDQQIYFPGRSVRLADMTFTNCLPVPSTNKRAVLIRCTVADALIEIDKSCEDIEFYDCTLRSIGVQSGSVHRMRYEGTTVTNFINGTCRETTIVDCVMPNLLMGCLGYGQSESCTITDTVFTGVVTGFAQNRVALSLFDILDGVMTYTGGGVLNMAVPGPAFLGGSLYTFGRAFNVLDIITDVDDKQILVTDLADVDATLPVAFGTVYIVWHPMPSVTASGLSGSVSALDLNTAPAGSPINSHGLRTWTADPDEDDRAIAVWGKLGSLASGYVIRVNVSQAYTGVNPTCTLQLGGQFDILPIMLADGTMSVFDLTINAKVAGERIIASDAITGAQVGDALGVAPGAITIVENFEPYLPDLSGESEAVRPIIEVEILLNNLPA